LADAVARIPTVLVASDIDLPGAGHVDIDNRRGGQEATADPPAQTQRTIAAITGPLDSPSARARLDGYRDALKDAGISADRSLVEPCVDWGLESGRRAADRLLESAPKLTAIFAQSDLLALGAIAALRARGMRVPEDVSVVGLGGSPVSSVFDPPLTPVRQPLREVGELAARLIGDRASSARRAKGTRHMLRAPLVIRGSVTRLDGARPR